MLQVQDLRIEKLERALKCSMASVKLLEDYMGEAAGGITQVLPAHAPIAVPPPSTNNPDVQTTFGLFPSILPPTMFAVRFLAKDDFAYVCVVPSQGFGHAGIFRMFLPLVFRIVGRR